MSGDWKPGDVAITKDGDHLLRGSAYWWGTLNGSSGRLYDDREIAPFEPLRRLLVIDPEDERVVAHLADAVIDEGRGYRIDYAIITVGLTKGLRGIASPAPRIEEPQGLGAVVEDAEGHRFVRHCDCSIDSASDWRCNQAASSAPSVRWADIKAVRVLSQGVTE